MQSLEITPRSLLFYLRFLIHQHKTWKTKKIISKSPHISQRSFLCGGSDKQQKNRQWQQEEKEKKRDVTHYQVEEDEAVTWLRVEQECDSCERYFSTQCSFSTDRAIQSHFKRYSSPKMTIVIMEYKRTKMPQLLLGKTNKKQKCDRLKPYGSICGVTDGNFHLSCTFKYVNDDYWLSLWQRSLTSS